MSDSDITNRRASPDRSWLYLDFDSFFASAEQHFNPELRGEAVGVVPLDVVGTGCIAISREAKARGVPSGANIRDARRADPDIRLVVARPDAYVRLHHRILAVIEECVPVANVRSIDELSCALVASESAEAEALARTIKVRLREAFSECLTCSIGIAPSEKLAKIAAEMNKPDGLVVLDRAQLPRRIADLPLGDIPGVSDGILSRLNRAGVRDVPALWRMGAKQCRALWGSIEGERFWCALHGYPYERPETEKRMFGHSRMLPLDWRTPERIHDCAKQLCLSAARRLRRSRHRATTLTFSARGGGHRGYDSYKPDDRKWRTEVAMRPACDDSALLAALGEAMERASGKRGLDFRPRSIGVMLHGLVDAEEAQGDLFAAPAQNGRERAERLSGAMDGLRERFGPEAVSHGMHDPLPGGYLGAKIAFGRIPDPADFGEAATADGDTQFVTV